MHAQRIVALTCVLLLTGCLTATAQFQHMKPEQQISEIQSDLKALGYYSGEIDGVYGNQTAEAIRALQRDRRMTQDGLVSQSVYIQAGLALSDSRKSKSRARGDTMQERQPILTAGRPSSPSNPSRSAAPNPCSTADWTGIVTNIADLFECDTPRAIETLSSGRRIAFTVGNVGFTGGQLHASMQVVPSYVTAASKANSSGNFSWGNWFDVTQSSPYTVYCSFGAGKASSLKSGANIEIGAKLVSYADRRARMECS